MGGSLSCIQTSGNEEKINGKASRPGDYTEIDDDFMESRKAAAALPSENGGEAGGGGGVHQPPRLNVEEELYENSSSIIRASSVELVDGAESNDSRTKPTPVDGGKSSSSSSPSSSHALAEVMKQHVAVVKTNGNKKANPTPPLPPPAAEKLGSHANGSRETPNNQKTPAFHLGNPSEIGHYQNVQPAALKKPEPSALKKTEPSTVEKPELSGKGNVEERREDLGDLYAKVQKPKPKIVNGNSQQLNYIQVEFVQTPPTETTRTNVSNHRSEQQDTPTAYTDVIHKDGKIMLVSPSS